MREKYETLPVGELKAVAKHRGIKGLTKMKKQEVIEAMLALDEEESKGAPKAADSNRPDAAQKKDEQREANSNDEPKPLPQYDDAKVADGILEVLQDGYGFIRCENYLPGENDVYV